MSLGDQHVTMIASSSTIMRRRRRPALPYGWCATTCPDCAGDLTFGEMIFSARSIQGWDADGVLYIGKDYEDFEEASDDEAPLLFDVLQGVGAARRSELRLFQDGNTFGGNGSSKSKKPQPFK
jgi:hypothetical protein